MRSKDTRLSVHAAPAVDRERRGGGRRRLRRAATVVAFLALASWPALAGGNWNEVKISWQSYDKGMAAAKAEKKPVCLIFYTEWCGHCTKYSAVFHDPRVVEQSKRFVMIRVDKDKNKDLSKQYAPDGEYIPRTYFLSAEGKLDPEIQGPNKKYKYFLDENDPASILSGMSKALAKTP